MSDEPIIYYFKVMDIAHGNMYLQFHSKVRGWVGPPPIKLSNHVALLVAKLEEGAQIGKLFAMEKLNVEYT